MTKIFESMLPLKLAAATLAFAAAVGVAATVEVARVVVGFTTAVVLALVVVAAGTAADVVVLGLWARAAWIAPSRPVRKLRTEPTGAIVNKTSQRMWVARCVWFGNECRDIPK
jgi:hypothetical protein